MSTVPKKRRFRWTNNRRRGLAGFLFISPWLIGLIHFFIRPLISTVEYSFNTLRITTEIRMRPAGWQYYIQMFTRDAEFLPALGTVLVSLCYQLPIILIFSFFMAILLNQKFRGRTFMRAVMFLPLVVVSSTIFSYLKTGDFQDTMYAVSGSKAIFNAQVTTEVFQMIGIGGSVVEYFSKAIATIFDVIWQCGLQIIVFLSGLQTIPTSMYEVARIEGATGWETFWKVTFVIISPVTLLNVIYTLIQHFTYAMDGLYTRLAGGLDYSYASAVMLVYSLLVIIIVGASMAIGRRFVFDRVSL